MKRLTKAVAAAPGSADQQSARRITLLPACARTFLPASVITRPLDAKPPTIDLVIGYNTANTSPTLRLFMQRSHELIARVTKRIYSDSGG